MTSSSDHPPTSNTQGAGLAWGTFLSIAANFKLKIHSDLYWLLWRPVKGVGVGVCGLKLSSSSGPGDAGGVER